MRPLEILCDGDSVLRSGGVKDAAETKGDALTGVPLKTAEKPFGFFRQRIAVCCAHNLCAIGAQIPHLQPEKYFLSRTCHKRK